MRWKQTAYKPMNPEAMWHNDRFFVCYQEDDNWRIVEGHFNRQPAWKARDILGKHARKNGRQDIYVVFAKDELNIIDRKEIE